MSLDTSQKRVFTCTNSGAYPRCHSVPLNLPSQRSLAPRMTTPILREDDYARHFVCTSDSSKLKQISRPPQLPATSSPRGSSASRTEHSDSSSLSGTTHQPRSRNVVRSTVRQVLGISQVFSLFSGGGSLIPKC